MAFMVPLVKNHYDIYNRHTSPDHEGSLYLSATSLDSVKSTKAAAAAAAATKKVAKSKNMPAVVNPAAIPASVAKGTNRKILIKVSTRPPPKSKSATGRVQSASISLPIARNEAGKPVLALKQKPLKALNGQGIGGRSKSAATAAAGAAGGTNGGELPVVTRPMPHIKRTLRNPYTNRVYSYSVSIPNYVAEEDEAALREYENDSSETDSSNGTPGNSLESVLLYSSSAPTSTTNLHKARLANGGAGGGAHGLGSDGASTGSSSEEEEYASNLSSPICPDSPTHESVAAGVMNCSATSLVYAYEAITAELNIPSAPLPGLATTSTKAKVKRMASAPGEMSSEAKAKTTTTDGGGDKDGGSDKSNANDNPRASTGNAREYIELLRKFIVHLKLLKLGSSKKLFTSSSKTNNNNNASSNNTNNNNNNNHHHHARTSSERRPRKDTMEDSKHL